MKFAILVLLLVSFAAFAQEPRGPGFLPNSVSVGADGEFESAPDTSVITCSLSAQENTSQAAFDSASRLAEQMRQALELAAHPCAGSARGWRRMVAACLCSRAQRIMHVALVDERKAFYEIRLTGAGATLLRGGDAEVR